MIAAAGDRPPAGRQPYSRALQRRSLALRDDAVAPVPCNRLKSPMCDPRNPCMIVDPLRHGQGCRMTQRHAHASIGRRRRRSRASRWARPLDSWTRRGPGTIRTAVSCRADGPADRGRAVAITRSPPAGCRARGRDLRLDAASRAPRKGVSSVPVRSCNVVCRRRGCRVRWRCARWRRPGPGPGPLSPASGAAPPLGMDRRPGPRACLAPNAGAAYPGIDDTP